LYFPVVVSVVAVDSAHYVDTFIAVADDCPATDGDGAPANPAVTIGRTLSQQHTVGTALTIIPEPERPAGGLIPATTTVSRCRLGPPAGLRGGLLV